jgi:hypothetical protein
MFLHKVGINLQEYTVSQPKRQQFKYSSPGKPENLQLRTLLGNVIDFSVCNLCIKLIVTLAVAQI